MKLATDTAVATSPPEDLEERARWAFAHLARRDLSRANEIWAPEAVDHFLPVGDAVGRGEIVAFFEELFAALPDLEIEVERVLTEDPSVVVQWRGVGTFSGRPFQGIRATGRRIEFRGCDVVQTSPDGLVLDNTVYWDGAEFARQIGMLPRRGSRGDRALTACFNAVTRLRTIGHRGR